MILGVHCPVMLGLDIALAMAVDLKCEAMQMLPYRRHHASSPEEVATFRAARARSGVRQLVIHSRFVPAPASSDEVLWRRSRELLALELGLALDLGAESYVLHAGAYSPGADARQGMRRMVQAVREASAQARIFPLIIIENVPGGGRRIGGTLDELAELLNLLTQARVPAGVCLDTAHAWAAGYDLSGARGMLEFVETGERLFGKENLRLFHLNDSAAPLGSHRENHENWSKGRLGLEGLKALLESQKDSGRLAILETPRGAERENLELIRRLNREL